MPLSWIWNRVNRIVNKYGTTNPFELADCCNYIPILDEKMNLWGRFIRTGKRDGVIFVNAKLTYHTKRLVAAHELGHAILGHETQQTDESFLCIRWYNMVKEERYANLFAIHLLSKGYDWSHGDLKLASNHLGIPLPFIQEYILARGIDTLDAHRRKSASINLNLDIR